MSKQLVFIDDSGDPGFKSVSSDNFVMAAALFIDSKNAESVMREIGSYRKELGWRYNHEFKFTKNPKNIVIELLKRVNQYDFRVYAVYIDKDDFRKITPGMVPFFDKERLYNWMIKELLQEMPIKTAKITIDGRSSKRLIGLYRQIRQILRNIFRCWEAKSRRSGRLILDKMKSTLSPKSRRPERTLFGLISSTLIIAQKLEEGKNNLLSYSVV